METILETEGSAFTVRGIVCESVGSFRFAADLPEPVPAPGEAVVTIRRIGICGTDYHAFRGNQPYFTYPRILGHELSGVIETLNGAEDSGLQPGDAVSVIPYVHCGSCAACRSGKTNCCTSLRVLGVHADGGMRERIAVPASLLLKTDRLAPDAAAMIEPLSIGAHAVRRSGVRPGAAALVIGAGPIGLGVMAFAKAAGARVIAMDVNGERLAFCKSWAKADETVNALEQPLERVRELTGGDLADVVFDATGNARSMTESFAYAGHGGTVVFVGLVKSSIPIDDPEFHKRELTLMGSRNATREDFLHVAAALEAGIVDVSRYVTHRAPFEGMIDAFAQWLSPESGVIKAVVELDSR